MTFRCYLLSLLRIHSPDCDCNVHKTSGDEMRRRLEELNWRTQPHSVEVFDPMPGEVVTQPISLRRYDAAGSEANGKSRLASIETCSSFVTWRPFGIALH